MTELNDEKFRDGTVILTEENFIMYTFGYNHPIGYVISYLKYIPKKYREKFEISFIDHEWNFRDIKMIRPKELYSPENFKSILASFNKFFPFYIFKSDFLQKEIFVVPRARIKELFIPEERLELLLNKENPDSHEVLAIELITLLSKRSKVPIKSFGIHGSTSYEMHSSKSDIDISIYGGNNFFKVKGIINKLVEEKLISRSIKISTDEYRKNRGIYKGVDFVFNAIRTLKETTNEYGIYKYTPIEQVKFECIIIDDSESIFREAIYIIKNVVLENEIKNVDVKKINQVVSMIGEFRGIARNGDSIMGFGMIEEVNNVKTNDIFFRIIIGSGVDKEYIMPKKLD